MSSPEKRKKKKKLMEKQSPTIPIPSLTGTSSPKKKKKKTVTDKKSPTPESTPIWSLPDDLILICIARLSRLYYPILPLVSKRFPPLLASPELYEFRSRLNRTESCLYVLIGNSDSNNTTRWFTLCRKPDGTGKRILVPIANSESPDLQRVEYVASGSEIYRIGGTAIHGGLTTRLSVLDCRFNTWKEAPRKRFDRLFTSSCFLDGKLYVIEGGYCNSLKEIEVFDTKTQIWSTLLVPRLKKINDESVVWRMVCFEGKLHFLSEAESSLVYDPRTSKWHLVEREMTVSWRWYHNFAVIGNVYYRHDYQKFVWYDTKAKGWKNVKGLPNIYCYNGLKMVDYCGKMAILWEESRHSTKCIRCAVIEFERRDGDEMWGKVEWSDSVFTVPVNTSDFLEAISVTL